MQIANELVEFDQSTKIMSLRSPVTGQIIKIKNPKVEIRASAEGLRDLMHIEEQIIGMSTLPDFGYQEDNYILNEKD